MMRRALVALVLIPASVGPLAMACASSSPHASSRFDGGGGGIDSTTGPEGDGGHTTKLPGMEGGGGPTIDEAGTTVFKPFPPVKDFPTPVLDGTAPATSAALFGPVSQGSPSGGPCIYEPESNVLYPQNWLRPRFRWTPGAGQNLFELRLHVANQLTDLVVYTSNASWTMPVATWDLLRTHSPTEAMTLTVRAGTYSGGMLTNESTGSSFPMGIAPVQATGAIVYWTTSTGTALKGFSVGDESVAQVLVPNQVKEAPATCIGCHSSSPDGEFVGIGYYIVGDGGIDYWPNALALIDEDAGKVGAAPTFLGAGGIAALAQYNRGISTFSRAHWTAGDRREITAYDDKASSTATLQWIDLEAQTGHTAWGTIARTGDPSSAAAPAWSHDGNTIAYVSTSKFCSGRLGAGCDGVTYTDPGDPGSTADIYTVPYAGGAGGAAKPLPGASEAMLQEYYPVYSPDDALIAFDRIPNDLNLYNQPKAEVFVLPASGGSATRLASNDPPMCTGLMSPGVTNSWPKWGPLAEQANGSTYYWLVFSSTRLGNPQLYITSVVKTGTTLATYGSIYLWNQPSTENNHTPAWDTFKVPPVIIPK